MKKTYVTPDALELSLKAEEILYESVELGLQTGDATGEDLDWSWSFTEQA